MEGLASSGRESRQSSQRGKRGLSPVGRDLHTGEGGTWRKDEPEPSASCPPCEARPWLEADGDLP
ncbi:hypothetical protein NQZ68_015673 [Dissostichus eleginoides]|nr:hypothetical protein NQZ68_015673 [Dissostichus eleginoides]